MKNILWLGGISVVISYGFLFLPTFCRGNPARVPRTEGLSNIRQVGLGLFAFEKDYGRFPDATTIPAVQAATGTTLALGTSSSNDLFRQLLATVGRSEKIFWAKTAMTPKKPNDILGVDALVAGECVFTYIAGLTSTSHPDAPILMTPVIHGTWKFDPKPFKGHAVVFFTDTSAIPLPIDKNGDVILNGMNLFDPRQPFWRGKAPDIKWLD
jgi:hypothetical protein